MFLLNKHVASVSARMMTWEVTTAFEGTLTETELRKRFDAELKEACVANGLKNCDELQYENGVFFWPLISFNASDGRKHRFLVTLADESLLAYHQKFDRCLPKQIALFSIADKILRGDWEFENSNSENSCNVCDVSNGNLMFAVLWNKTLYVLIFVGGRLCHWSEENGYGRSFDEHIKNRIARFREFLKADELFASTVSAESFGEIFVNCNFLTNMNELFRLAANDPFWRRFDLDKYESMKPCEKRRWTLGFVALFAFSFLIVLVFGDSLNFCGVWFKSCKQTNTLTSVPPVELSSPTAHDLEMLAWAEGHRDLLPAKWIGMRDEISCNLQGFKILGIVSGRTALVTFAGEMKTLSVGDSILSYRVKEIGINDIVLRCHGKEVRYDFESQISVR